MWWRVLLFWPRLELYFEYWSWTITPSSRKCQLHEIFSSVRVLCLLPCIVSFFSIPALSFTCYLCGQRNLFWWVGYVLVFSPLICFVGNFVLEPWYHKSLRAVVHHRSTWELKFLLFLIPLLQCPNYVWICLTQYVWRMRKWNLFLLNDAEN